MLMRLLVRSSCIAVFIWLFSFSLAIHAQSSKLDQIRHDLAMRYLEPSPHMALAKFYFDKGDRLQSFYILEAARRGRFEEAIFNQAFLDSFSFATSLKNDDKVDTALLNQYQERIEALVEIRACARECCHYRSRR